MERSRREGFLFGAKLVRGAYLDLENRVAKQKGYPSPLWQDIEHTHANYDKCVPARLRQTRCVSLKWGSCMLVSAEAGAPAGT